MKGRRGVGRLALRRALERQLGSVMPRSRQGAVDRRGSRSTDHGARRNQSSSGRSPIVFDASVPAKLAATRRERTIHRRPGSSRHRRSTLEGTPVHARGVCMLSSSGSPLVDRSELRPTFAKSACLQAVGDSTLERSLFKSVAFQTRPPVVPFTISLRRGGSVPWTSVRSGVVWHLGRTVESKTKVLPAQYSQDQVLVTHPTTDEPEVGQYDPPPFFFV